MRLCTGSESVNFQINHGGHQSATAECASVHVESEFMYADLDEDISTTQVPDMEIPEEYCLKLRKVYIT